MTNLQLWTLIGSIWLINAPKKEKLAEVSVYILAGCVGYFVFCLI